MLIFVAVIRDWRGAKSAPAAILAYRAMGREISRKAKEC